MQTLNLEPYLEDLENRLDPAQEQLLLGEWRLFSAGGYERPVFSPRRDRSAPPRLEWPQATINSTLDDFDRMALQQYRLVSETLASGSGAVLNVRSNYGTAIMPTLFGAEVFIMDEALETLPTTRPLSRPGSLRRLLDSDLPQPQAGWGARALEMGQRFTNIARTYPKIGQYVFIIHPDCQGPLDICELLLGSRLFYALYDTPELVHALLERVTTTYLSFMHAWSEIVPFQPDGNAHWGLYHRGSLMLRDDSAMNLSGAMYAEFAGPYDQRLLDEFGGGALHFCGKGDHFIAPLSRLRGLHAVNLAQPHLNDMEKIFTHTIDRGILLLALERAAVEAALASGRNLRGRVHYA